MASSRHIFRLAESLTLNQANDMFKGEKVEKTFADGVFAGEISKVEVRVVLRMTYHTCA